MKKEYLYAGVSILLWSTSATVTKLLLSNLNSMQILFISSFIAFIFLLIINLVKGNLKELKKYKLKDYVQIFIIGLLGTFLYNLFLYLGISKMQASDAFIINYLWPIMTVLCACIILKEKLTLRKIIAIIISFIGVVIVAGNGNILNITKNNLTGAIYCIIAAISCGLFSSLNKKKNYNKFSTTMLFYLFSFLICLVYMLVSNKFYVPETNQFLGLLWIGIFTSAVAFTSWVLALEKGDITKISNLAYITPFLSLIWTGLILKEKISIYAVLGLVIIVLGIFVQMKEKK